MYPVREGIGGTTVRAGEEVVGAGTGGHTRPVLAVECTGGCGPLLGQCFETRVISACCQAASSRGGVQSGGCVAAEECGIASVGCRIGSTRRVTGVVTGSPCVLEVVSGRLGAIHIDQVATNGGCDISFHQRKRLDQVVRASTRQQMAHEPMLGQDRVKHFTRAEFVL